MISTPLEMRHKTHVIMHKNTKVLIQHLYERTLYKGVICQKIFVGIFRNSEEIKIT